MCVDTQVHVAVVYRGSPGSWHDAGCCNSVKVETGSAMQGRPQQVASVCSCSSDGNTGGGGCSDKMASSVASIFDIIMKNVLDLEARISDIYHVISCISHFLWILYIKCCHGEL